jgi:hypothetical protein
MYVTEEIRTFGGSWELDENPRTQCRVSGEQAINQTGPMRSGSCARHQDRARHWSHFPAI